MEGCSRLQHLNVSGRSTFTAKGVAHLASLGCLQTLDMARVGAASAEKVEAQDMMKAILLVVGANAATLESLNVSILRRIDDYFVALLAKKAKMLRQLFILDSAELTDLGLRALAGNSLTVCSNGDKSEG